MPCGPIPSCPAPHLGLFQLLPADVLQRRLQEVHGVALNGGQLGEQREPMGADGSRWEPMGIKQWEPMGIKQWEPMGIK